MVTIDYNSNTRMGKLLCDAEIIEHVRNHFSQPTPGIDFIKRVNQHVNPRQYAVTPTGMFKIGLHVEIISFLRHQLNMNVSFTEKFTKYLNKKFNYNLIEYPKYPLRDYQHDIVNQCLSTNNGIVVLGTGGGKTLTMCTLLETIYQNSKDIHTFKCLIVVPDIGLVTQTYNDFIEYGCTFSLQKWTGNSELSIDSNVIICNMQILLRRFKQYPWLSHIDLLLVDETHRCIAPELQKTLSKIKTENRYGFTGTLPINKFDYWSVIGNIGPRLYEKRSKSLRDEKYLTNVECKILRVDYNNVDQLVVDDTYQTEVLFKQENTFRNSIIKKICTGVTNNILLLVNRIEHGLILRDLMGDCGKQVFFIQGSVEVETREEIKRIIENNNDVVCIAISKIFSTGINIKNLHYIMFCSSGKAFIQIVQSIGRGLRLHPLKSKLVIFDIADNLKYGNNHLEVRKKIYDMEQIHFTEKTITEQI